MILTSFISIADANEYFATRLDSQDWDDASDSDKQKALVTATRAINNLRFKSDFAINSDIQVATCEEALARLSGIDMEVEIKNLINIEKNYALMRTNQNPALTRDWIKAGIASGIAWQFLVPYLHDPRCITIGVENSNEQWQW